METNQESPFEHFENSKVLVASLSAADRVAFYKKTYAHVAGGVLVFILFEYLLLQSSALIEFMFSMMQGWRWLIMLGGFMLVT
ncbi:MAG: permease, partial [Mangrovimonas sp.]|nr:permease [Mangrovimonas sp.]